MFYIVLISTVARSLLFISWIIYFIFNSWRQCGSAHTFLCVWAVRRSSSREEKERGAAANRLWTLNQRDDKQQQQQQHSASVWLLQLSDITHINPSESKPPGRASIRLFLLLDKLLGTFSLAELQLQFGFQSDCNKNLAASFSCRRT